MTRSSRCATEPGSAAAAAIISAWISASSVSTALKRSALSEKLANTAPVDRPAAAAIWRMVAPS